MLRAEDGATTNPRRRCVSAGMQLFHAGHLFKKGVLTNTDISTFDRYCTALTGTVRYDTVRYGPPLQSGVAVHRSGVFKLILDEKT